MTARALLFTRLRYIIYLRLRALHNMNEDFSLHRHLPASPPRAGTRENTSHVKTRTRVKGKPATELVSQTHHGVHTRIYFVRNKFYVPWPRMQTFVGYDTCLSCGKTYGNTFNVAQLSLLDRSYWVTTILLL